MDDNLQQDIDIVMAQLPKPIQAYCASGKIGVVAKNLMQKYQLHIDQGAIMEREIAFLLLGLKDPDEFRVSLLAEANLNDQTVKNIMLDVNTQIFMPLREQMQDEPVEQKTTQAQPAPKPIIYPPAPVAPKDPAQEPPQPAPLINLLRTPPSAPTPPISQIQQPAPSVSQRPSANERPYSVDPYREPLDDK